MAKIRHLTFPVALQLNSSACMIVVIALGLFKQSAIAADVAVVHGATLALLLSFAANARSSVLNSESGDAFNVLVRARLLLLLPLATGSLLLAMLFSNIPVHLAVAVVVRRSAEWLAELAISEAERLRFRSLAMRFIFIDVISLISVTASFFMGTGWNLFVLVIWAVLPIMTSWPFLQMSLVHGNMNIRKVSLISHFGSSLVIGTSTYVFRVLIVLLVGKEVAGNLFAAFSVGSMAGTAFSSGVGPTLLLQSRTGTISSNRVAVFITVCLAALGIAVLAIVSGLGFSEERAREFWQAMGFSLLGGALMVQAQYYRLKQLQESSAETVFPADILANILAVAVLPPLYLVSQGRFLLAAYFCNAIISLIIYWRTTYRTKAMLLSHLQEPTGLAITYSLFLLPVFVQAGSGIFRDPAFLFDSGGSIMRLPIPLSVAACGLGYFLLKGIEHARFSLCLIFFTFVSLVIAAIGNTVGQTSDQPSKLILAMQFLLPMFAMPLGQLAGRREMSSERLARSFLYVLMFVVPAQLAATWLKGDMLLQPYLGVFSVYQHLQYVPIVFVTAYILCVFVLWDKSQKGQLENRVLSMGGPIMGIYVLFSGSLMGSVSLVSGLLVHAFSRRRTNVFFSAIRLAIATILIVSVGLLSESHLGHKVSGSAKEPTGFTMPVNVQERLATWKYYTEGALQSVSTFIMGNSRVPDRSLYTSAHNYYLDLLYNFGLLGLVPISSALFITLKRIVENWSTISHSTELQALVGVVMFLVIVDNSLKVGLRQPYPGLFSFFLWGFLLSRLQVIRSSFGSIANKTD